MSIHSSLRTGGAGNKFRSVLKRHERLKVLQEKGLWDEEKSVLGIPKVKQQKIKVKKEKAAADKPAEGAAAAGAAPTDKPAAGAGKETPASGKEKDAGKK